MAARPLKPAPPLRARAVLWRSLDVARRRFPSFLLLTFVCNLPAYIAHFALMDGFGESTDAGSWSVPALMAGYAAYFLVGPVTGAALSSPTMASLGYGALAAMGAVLTTGVAAYAVTEDSRGRRFPIREALAAALRRFGPLAGVGAVETILRTLGAPFLAAPAVIVLCVLFVAEPVCVVERQGVLASLRRSADLTRGRRWALFRLLLLFFCVGEAYYVGAALLEPPTLVLYAVTEPLTAWWAIVSGVAYVHLRTAREQGGDVARVFE